MEAGRVPLAGTSAMGLAAAVQAPRDPEIGGLSDHVTTKRGGKRPGAGRPRAPGESLENARRRKERALADLRELEVRKKRGNLVDADAVATEWTNVLRQVRARVVAVASRVHARLPHLTAHDASVLDEELRLALAELANAE
jgi:phage terminase Nu1 subunit (DNA packaging protein)